MLTIEKKMVVAENCLEYKPKMEFFMYVGLLDKSCINCENYSDNQCNKNLFSSISKKIEVN